MFDFLKMLLQSRMVTFEKGKIMAVGTPLVMQPACFHSMLAKFGEDDPGLVYKNYSVGKDLATKEFCRVLAERYKVERREMLDTMVNVAHMSGWGKFTIANFDFEKKRAVVRCTGSPIAEYQKSEKAVCHSLRGITAGVMMMALEDDSIEAIEGKCVAKGDACCEIICMPWGEFDKKDPLVQEQLKGVLDV